MRDVADELPRLARLRLKEHSVSPIGQLYVSLTAVVIATAVVTLIAFWRGEL